MTSSRPPRRSSRPPLLPPQPMGTSATELREGVPWTVLGGVVFPEMLRAAAARYRELGGGPVWVFEAHATQSYRPASIGAALDIAERASRDAGLKIALVSCRSHSVISMGVSVLRMRANLFAQPVRYLSVASVEELRAEVEAWRVEQARRAR
ncbi:hypothetical protein [Sorangium sp. So ce388]|uniref:hypothetical protein n=1 Tax=Sorangium sp. So ce388 TaxID=3133309 RepID=UPI003F5B87E7